ncbi:hypothetical protein [Sphingosinicella humi]|uniref:Uncharacterized protein n=1 Tax=Allosphingosinicella humi TaxID=2068657 RepID=A0A2U2J0D6_9SPHN|nr:hypothetical protein [Sphingosinicella humi]PWG01798.1 hypothetical protein DF286_02115 [Sphingosinicella humi]
MFGHREEWSDAAIQPAPRLDSFALLAMTATVQATASPSAARSAAAISTRFIGGIVSAARAS